MDNAAVALKLLLCGDEDQATGIAERLAEINTERQQTEQQVFAAALQTLEADPARTRDRVLVVSGEDWHPGVIGIVAARLMERFSRRPSSFQRTRARDAAAAVRRTPLICTALWRAAPTI